MRYTRDIMKKSIKGFAPLLLILIIAIGAIVCGAFYFNAQEESTSEIPSDQMFSITSPTYDDVLEPGKSFTISYTPIKEAAKYEITITEPLLMTPTEPYRGGGLVSPDELKILLQATTTDTSHTITVPNSQYPYLTGSSYNGDILIVKALDAKGRVLTATMEYEVEGKTMSVPRPLMDQQQIMIIPLPNQPELLDADVRVLNNDGGTITLKFGALPSKYKTREVLLMCYFQEGSVSIDATTCPDGRFTAGSDAFTKTLTVKPSITKGSDTSFAIRARYYDPAGKGDDYGLLDSWLSIKIRK
jgi:hypothetical protein